MKIVIFLVLALAACGGDLPPLILATPHVRYHARTPDELPTEGESWLEEYRADLLTYFGVFDAQHDSVIDYYRFRDNADLVQNSPCPRACTTEPAAVYTVSPLDDYELVHGFLAPIGGLPPRMIGEGTARVVSCYSRDTVQSKGVSTWPEVVRQGDSADQYTYGQVVVRQLLDQFGPSQFIKYYADAHFTTDPGLFALDFERSVGVPFTPVWNAALSLAGPALKRTCPCTLDPLPLNSTFVLKHPGHAVYRPLELPDAGALLLTVPPGSSPSFKECANSGVGFPLVNTNALNGTNLAIVKASGKNYISFDYGAVSDHLATAVGDWVDETCSMAASVPVSTGTIGIAVLATYPGDDAPYYLNLSVAGSRQVALPFAIDSAFGTVDLCTDCSLNACSRLGTTPVTISGNGVLVLRPGTAVQGLTYTTAQISFI